jgi:hypothetical protein
MEVHNRTAWTGICQDAQERHILPPQMRGMDLLKRFVSGYHYWSRPTWTEGFPALGTICIGCCFESFTHNREANTGHVLTKESKTDHGCRRNHPLDVQPLEALQRHYRWKLLILSRWPILFQLKTLTQGWFFV